MVAPLAAQQRLNTGRFDRARGVVQRYFFLEGCTTMYPGTPPAYSYNPRARVLPCRTPLD